MINSSLLEIFRELDKKELTRFDELVRSPYYNKRSAVIKFWDAIKVHAPKFDSPELSRENIYKKIFPSKKFNYGTLKNLIYDTTKLAEVFLELERASQKPLQRFENLLEILLIKGLNSHFEKNFRDAQTHLQNSTVDGSNYNKRHSLETLRQNYLIMTDKQYETLSSINDANRYMTLEYFMDTFVNNYNAVFMKSEITHVDRAAIDDYIAKAVSYYRSHPVETDYLIEIFFNAFMLAYEAKDENFYNLRKLLKENDSKLTNEEKYNFYVALANYADKRSESSNDFIMFNHEIYRYMIESSIYSISNISTIDGNFYRKAASTAEAAGELDWAIGFINEYKGKLDEPVRENYFNHAMVEYHLVKKEFNTALEYLVRVKHTNPLDKLNIKSWQMICFYELGYFEELRNLIDSTRHFLSKDKKILQERKDKLYNFITVLTSLAVIKENYTISNNFAGDVILLLKQLDPMDCLHKKWLREKIRELT